MNKRIITLIIAFNANVRQMSGSILAVGEAPYNFADRMNDWRKFVYATIR